MSVMPELEMDCSVSYPSMSYPARVIEVLTPRKITIQYDSYQRTDNNGLSEDQSYIYSKNLKGEVKTATLRKDGRWRLQGCNTAVMIGHKRAYFSPSM